MYETYEINGPRRMWTPWLASFYEGELREIDPQDRSKIATSISNNFHKKGLGVFTIIKNEDGTFVKRELNGTTIKQGRKRKKQNKQL